MNLELLGITPSSLRIASNRREKFSRGATLIGYLREPGNA
jgi:hypothetical protein